MKDDKKDYFGIEGLESISAGAPPYDDKEYSYAEAIKDAEETLRWWFGLEHNIEIKLIKSKIPRKTLTFDFHHVTFEPEAGATCSRCKEHFPYADNVLGFECWACKNGY